MKEQKVVYSSNISWTIQKGSWLIHFVVTFLIGNLLVTVFGKNKGLQIVTITYNIVSFIFFHWIVGDPFKAEFKEYTFWEQMQSELENSSTLMFMALYPIVLFFFVHRLVDWNRWMFYIAMFSLFLVVIPKLGFMHMKRIFGIKRYD